MIVQAYVNQFEYLARFYSQGIIEGWRSWNFERGLRHELRKVIVSIKIKGFSVFVD